RMVTDVEVGILSAAASAWPRTEAGGHILVVEDQDRAASRLRAVLARAGHQVEVEARVQGALQRLGARKPYDVVIISLGLAEADGLRLCGRVRALEHTRRLPIIVVVQPSDKTRLLRTLDVGVHDYLTPPVDRNELLARVRTEIRRKRHSDYLRGRLEESIELAVTDALTGLHNRRYMETHLKLLAEQAREGGRPLSVVLVDIDNFKSVNDTYGHAVGDNVLREFATRFRRNTRAVDLACRIGGEEFAIVMPDTELERACQVGERLRECIASEPFQTDCDTSLEITASVGIATLDGADCSIDALFRRADQALYVAKRGGRNRVVADAAWSTGPHHG